MLTFKLLLTGFQLLALDYATAECFSADDCAQVALWEATPKIHSAWINGGLITPVALDLDCFDGDVVCND